MSVKPLSVKIDLTDTAVQSGRPPLVLPHGAQESTHAVRLAKIGTVVADLLAISIAMAAALLVLSTTPEQARADAVPYLRVALLSVPLWIMVFGHFRLYNANRISNRLEEVRRVIQAVGTSVVLVAAVSFSLHYLVSRGWLALTFVFGGVAVLIERGVVRRIFTALRRRGLLLRPVIIVGANIEACALADMLISRPSLGYTVLGFTADGPAILTESSTGLPPVLGAVSETARIVELTGASGVIIAATATDLEVSNQLTRQLTQMGAYVELSMTLRDIAPQRLAVRPLGRFPVACVDPVRPTGWRAVAKRLLDVTLASALLVVTLPMLLIAAAAIKANSPGPVLFRQKRVGLGGDPFEVLKLRTMVREAPDLTSVVIDLNEADGPLFKIRRDPRVTRVGRPLRKLSVDELPQLWNVIRGEMSLVGPRPALPDELTQWTPELFQRLKVKPGITGMWQVSGRSDASFEEYVRLDLYYVDNWSLWSDLAMIAKTVPTVLLRRGSY